MFFTVKEAAKELRVSPRTILRRLEEGRFPHAQRNGKWRIPRCCVDGHPEEAEVAAESQPTRTPEDIALDEEERQLALNERKEQLRQREGSLGEAVQKRADVEEAARQRDLELEGRAARLSQSEGDLDARDQELTAREKNINKVIQLKVEQDQRGEEKVKEPKAIKEAPGESKGWLKSASTVILWLVVIAAVIYTILFF